MKKMNLAAASGLAAVAAAAGLAHAQAYGDVAKVLSATPVYERVTTPRRECRLEPVTVHEERRSVRPAPEEYRPEPQGIGAGAVLGAIVGGVIGHQFGHSSHGRDVGTGVGAILGGIVGHSIESESGYQAASRDVVIDRVPVTREVERCRDVREPIERIVAYDVRYEYNGRQFEARLPFDPGPQMAVNVEVRPPASRMPMGPRPYYRGPY